MKDKKIPYSLLLPLATLILLISPDQALTYAEKQEPYETVSRFCNQKNNTKDIDFCTRVLKSDPRSAGAKDNVDLLLISDDLGIKRLNKTRDYLVSSCKKEGSKSKLKDCLEAYRVGILNLKILPVELKDAPELASYDALMASDAMYSCRDSLEKLKISDPYVLRRHKIDLMYVRLCVDISMTVG